LLKPGVGVLVGLVLRVFWDRARLVLRRRLFVCSLSEIAGDLCAAYELRQAKVLHDRVHDIEQRNREALALNSNEGLRKCIAAARLALADVSSKSGEAGARGLEEVRRLGEHLRAAAVGLPMSELLELTPSSLPK